MEPAFSANRDLPLVADSVGLSNLVGLGALMRLKEFEPQTEIALVPPTWNGDRWPTR
jgi:hypothetical protein